jgi:hypothetical protein
MVESIRAMAARDRSIRLRRPSPALVIGAIALFAALGGTGYAASHSGKSPTKAQVKKMIAAYVNSHKKELTGAAGSAGAAGGPGPAGAAGPGAVRIFAEGSSTESGSHPAGNAGPWTVTLLCSGSTPNATMVVHGPGTAIGTDSISNGGAPAATYVGTPVLAEGMNLAVNDGAQLSATTFLRSGSTLYELKFLITAENGGLFTNCSLVGDAIPVS